MKSNNIIIIVKRFAGATIGFGGLRYPSLPNCTYGDDVRSGYEECVSCPGTLV